MQKNWSFEEETKMASVPSPSPPSDTPNQVETATNNGVFQVDDKKPSFADGLDHLDSPQCIERFRKYDDDYANRLLAKYLSNKSSYGGNIFDVQITVGEKIVKSSRLTCYSSYANPVVGFEDECSNGSTPPADSQANLPNGKHLVKKN